MTRSGKPFDEEAYEASRAPELIAQLQATITESRLLHAQLLDVITEMEHEGILGVTGYSKLPHLVAEVLRVPMGQARSLVDQATQVAESLTPTGHTTPAPLPNVRAALREGLVDGQHIEAIAKTLKEMPDIAPLGTRELVESTLAEAARTQDHRAVLDQGKHLLQHLDPDGTQPDDPPESQFLLLPDEPQWAHELQGRHRARVRRCPRRVARQGQRPGQERPPLEAGAFG